MIVLGLIDSKPSAAALVEDGRILAAIEEERLCRLKMAEGVPRQAISQVLEVAGLYPTDVDLVAVAQHALAYVPEPVPWYGWFADDALVEQSGFRGMSSKLAPLVGKSKLALKAHHLLKRAITSDRLRKLPALLRESYGIAAPCQFYDHHLCHAASAYYTSGFDEALVLTLDGGGDGRSGSVYVGRNGHLTELASIDSFHSLGNLYAYVTALCGFKAELHEGKITGLAAYDEPAYADILRECVDYVEPGQIQWNVPSYHRSALIELRKRLPEDFDKAKLAASVQLVLEEVGTAFARYWLQETSLHKVVVAGGVFANVKLNQRIHELEGIEGFFVHPAMVDSGLSVGAAIHAQSQQAEEDPQALISRLPNVYFGPKFDDDEIHREIASAGLVGERQDDICQTVAELLAEGYVVARFTGRMEYGPRALGHRSILYQTTDASVNDWLNDRLKRTEFMPFAPATLVEYAETCYERLAGAEDPARFMTVTFDCSEEMQATSPGVVHIDGTARPQIVDSDTAPDFYRILSAYHALTGIPSLINTSFNMHGEPIVCTPEDALRSFKDGRLDYLAIGDWLVENPAIERRDRDAD